jgi:hypothetical protein
MGAMTAPSRVGVVGGWALLWVQALVVTLSGLGVMGVMPVWAGVVGAMVSGVVLVWAVRRWWWARDVGCWRLVWLSGGLSAAGAAWAVGRSGTAIGLVGVVLMAGGFVLGLWWVVGLLSWGGGGAGVARAVVREAVRMKIAMVFVVGLVLLVPALPWLLDPDELLKYRLQFFLTWAMSGVGGLLGLMTVFLGCGTICYELRDRQVFLTLTKPLSRWRYLLGKWLGIVLLDALLVAVGGGGVYVFAEVLRHQGARDEADRLAVEEQVMAARVSVQAQPVSVEEMSRMFDRRVERLKAEDPARYGGVLGAGDRREIERSVIAKWHVIGPRDEGRYVFRGLGRAGEFGPTIQLRMKPQSSKIPPDGKVRLALWLNGRAYGQLTLADNLYHVIDLPVSAVDGNGDLEVRLANVDIMNPEGTFASSVMFSPGEGLEVLYQVGRFGPNLCRAMLVVWVKLGFLAVLGLTAGTLLDFPVACLLSLLVYVAAMASGFIDESLKAYVPAPSGGEGWWGEFVGVPAYLIEKLSEGEWWMAVKLMIQCIGKAFMYLVPSLGEYNSTAQLADGRLIAWGSVGMVLGKVGLLCGGLCGLLGWAVFRRRELARVIA